MKRCYNYRCGLRSPLLVTTTIVVPAKEVVREEADMHSLNFVERIVKLIGLSPLAPRMVAVTC